jgi:hypothetical protein
MTVICRNPRTAEWLNNGLSFIALPFVIGLMVAGAGMIFNFVTAFSGASLNFAENSMELIASAAIIVVTLVAIKALQIKKRLAFYEPSAIAQVVELSGNASPVGQPPHQPRPVRRAA